MKDEFSLGHFSLSGFLNFQKDPFPKKRHFHASDEKSTKNSSKEVRKKIAARFREDRKKLARCASYKAISLLVLVYWSLKFTQNQKKHEETNRNPAHPKAGT